MGNAVKFTERGEIVLRASKSMARQRAELCFEVTDTGIGVQAADRPRLFDAFSQLDGSVTPKDGGTGLGLAISKRLVELAGGAIGVREGANGGSVFWFTLPLPPGTRERQLPHLKVDGRARDRPERDVPRDRDDYLARQLKVNSAATPEQAEHALDDGEPYRLIIADAKTCSLDALTRLMAHKAREPKPELLLMASLEATLTEEVVGRKSSVARSRSPFGWPSSPRRSSACSRQTAPSAVPAISRSRRRPTVRRFATCWWLKTISLLKKVP